MGGGTGFLSSPGLVIYSDRQPQCRILWHHPRIIHRQLKHASPLKPPSTSYFMAGNLLEVVIAADVKLEHEQASTERERKSKAGEED